MIDLEGHLIGPPAGDPRVDITDIYIFQKPGDATRSILVFNVNPLTLATAFRHDAIYAIKVDTNGDAIPDIAFRTKFSEVGTDGSQTATVTRAELRPDVIGDVGDAIIIKNALVSFGSTPEITESGHYKYFAGKRSDPFFFDLLGFFKNPINFTGSDFFIDKNVFGTVLELPKTALGPHHKIGIWARVLIPDPVTEHMVQIDRMGRPAINTVFMKGQDKVKFNAG